MKTTSYKQGIPANHYTREYFLSGEYYNAAKEYDKFVNGGNPPSVYLRAFSYLPKPRIGAYLDIGCGKGELVIHLARLGHKAIGIDYADAAIDICQSTLRHEKPAVKKLAHFEVADATRLPFPDESFDAVFFLDVIEHLTKTETDKALDELTRVLKKDGRVIMHTNNRFFERGTKLFIVASYHGIKAFLNPRKFLHEPSQPDHPYEYMHINYVTPTWTVRQLQNRKFRTTIEYPKPERKSKIAEYLPYDAKWKRLLYINIGWILFNSPLILFFSPAFWLVGHKTSR